MVQHRPAGLADGGARNRTAMMAAKALGQATFPSSSPQSSRWSSTSRRAFLCGLTLGTISAPLAAHAQQTEKIPRVGVIANRTGYEAFREGLRELAYKEGRDIALEFRSTEATGVRFLDLATEFVRIRVDVIVAASTPAILAAKQATATIPIVGLSVDPVASGLVSSPAQPRGNITGLSFNEVDTSAKRIALLKEAVPSITRVAVLTTPANPSSSRILRETESAARTLDVQVHALELREPDDFEKTFAAMITRRADSLIVLPATLPFTHRTRIIALAIRNRLPSMFWRREFVDIGGLMAYGPDQPEMYRRAAVLVSKILQGAKPADLPVEQPRKFALIINLKTAKALGLTIPQSVLLLADQVIE
jgi:putative ABC transport system substrate-binding protein